MYYYLLILDEQGTFVTTVSEGDRRKLYSVNQDEKYLFHVIDNCVDVLHQEFNSFPKEYILETLIGNSMNLQQTYQYLKNPTQGIINIFMLGHLFTEPENQIIKSMKDSAEYNQLISKLGKDKVRDRIDFLSGQI